MYISMNFMVSISQFPADLTVSKRPGTSYQIDIHFAVVNHLYLLFSFVSLIKNIISLPEIYKQSKLYFMRNLVIRIEKMDFYLTTGASAFPCFQINWFWLLNELPFSNLGSIF